MSGFRRFSKEGLFNFSFNAFVKAGLTEESSRLISEHLVEANLRGVDSHGVIRVPQYVEGVKLGIIDPKGIPEVIRESGFSVIIDGNRAPGIVVASECSRIAVEKAEEHGIGAVGARNLGHVGMLGYYARRISKKGLISFAFANGPALVAPWGGAEKIFGTNPFCYGFPVRGGEPIILDIATSAMASFKIKVAMLRGERLPEGVALDPEGKPTTDPSRVFRIGTILPFGGHKGYGISLLVELLTHALIGAPASTEVRVHGSAQGGFLVAAIDPEVFREREEFERDVEELVKRIKRCKPANGFEEVLLPGELEERTERERTENGIPLDEGTIEELRKVAEELGVEFPEPLDG
ncbi:MAG: Ldh family oxidoreductase [Archaeoglobi archaeon]|nr:Ldh family oxidoreductase [Candidatus Mnemosynella sp.]